MFIDFAIAAATLATIYLIYCILGSNSYHEGYMNAKGWEPMSLHSIPAIFIPRFMKGYIASARNQGNQQAFEDERATHPDPDRGNKTGIPLPATIIVPAKFPYGSKSAKAYKEGYNNFFTRHEEQKRKAVKAEILSRNLVRR